MRDLLRREEAVGRVCCILGCEGTRRRELAQFPPFVAI